MFNKITEAMILQYSDNHSRAVKCIEKVIESSGARDELEIYLLIPLLVGGETDRALSIIQSAIENKIAPIILIQIIVHLKTLKERTPKLYGVEEAISNLEKGIAKE